MVDFSYTLVSGDLLGEVFEGYNSLLTGKHLPWAPPPKKNIEKQNVTLTEGRNTNKGVTSLY